MNPSDDIGLTDFFVLVYRFFLKNILLISIMTVMGFGIGFFYAKQKPKYFSSELVGFSNLIKQTTLLELLSPISTLAEEKNYSEIAAKLRITEEEAAHIRSIEFAKSRHLTTSNSPELTDKKLGELILINVMVYDQTILPSLETGITSFIKDNPFVSEIEKLEFKKTNTLISDISRNLRVTDSIRLSQTKTHSKSAISISESFNPTSYNETAELLSELRLYKNTLQPFTIVSGFYTTKKLSNKTVMIVTAITLVFFTLSLIIVFIRELARLAKE